MRHPTRIRGWEDSPSAEPRFLHSSKLNLETRSARRFHGEVAMAVDERNAKKIGGERKSILWENNKNDWRCENATASFKSCPNDERCEPTPVTTRVCKIVPRQGRKHHDFLESVTCNATTATSALIRQIISRTSQHAPEQDVPAPGEECHQESADRACRGNNLWKRTKANESISVANNGRLPVSLSGITYDNFHRDLGRIDWDVRIQVEGGIHQSNRAVGE